jgi:hypothetical protein
MPDHTLPHIRIPPDYAEFLSSSAGLNIDGLELRSGPLESMAEYVHSERIPVDFPRPADHFVIGDYLIDLPVMAIDLRNESSSYGRVLGYAYGKYWPIADSLSDFLQRLKIHQDGAVWVKES